MRNKFVTLTALALMGFTGAAFAADAVYYRQTASSVNLSSAPSTPVTIAAVTIPAGTWIVTAKANPVNFGSSDYVRCFIIVGSTDHDGGTTLIGGESGPFVAEIVAQTVVTTTSSKVFELQCQHDFDTAGIYVDPQASIIVSKSSGPIG